ncbi:adenylyltransferase and sulfurtransferase MOCS3 [Pelobates cultripes]|uniref:Adenylyltransferase and sulfurtransferase MOCS3, partial n=1 Tax=Pelobates cultripes TaxID=61616 RepID=A0AAD1VM30_PELCU|nr:adenylyltransferase and sulfurtransferase MOCS3 [Pelobates cultripes]
MNNAEVKEACGPEQSFLRIMESADTQSLQDEIKWKDEEILSLREKLGALQRASITQYHRETAWAVKVADYSDNVPTRYLVNGACVAAGKPLVSASALKWDGQLTVYNYQGEPCYRCLFPNPPPPETITNCADGGVLGIVSGIIGSLKALEVLKIASEIPSSYSGVLLMYNALDGQFRNIKIRSKKPDCVVCSDNSEYVILKNYETFCGLSASDRSRMLNLLSKEE